MKMYIEPSNMLAVTPRARSRLSGIRKKNVVFNFIVQYTFNEQAQSTLWSRAIPLDIQNGRLLGLVSKILRLSRRQISAQFIEEGSVSNISYPVAVDGGKSKHQACNRCHERGFFSSRKIRDPLRNNSSKNRNHTV